jgi:hypothetical protein
VDYNLPQSNIDVDPQFISIENNDFHLAANSFCINSGHPDSTDSDGTRADMGAFPYLNDYSGPDWYVATNGNDTTGTGAIDNPFASIQAGINFASDGDSVSVAAGTYYENINFRGRNIKVFGEEGAENTIIDADQNFHVAVFENNESRNSILKGFTLQNGLGDWDPNHIGGGVYIANSSPTISSCIIQNFDHYYYGAGIAIRGNSNPFLENLIIKNNTAYHGGGIAILENASVQLHNSLLYNNSASDAAGTGMGGGIYCNNPWNYTTPLIITHCTFIENISGGLYNQYYGGGIFTYRSNSTRQIINSIFWGNIPNQIQDKEDINIPVEVIYSDIDEGYPGVGNITSNPNFVNTATLNLHLQDYSFCIGAGLDTNIVPITDIEGNPRPNPAGSNPDMGAYESPLAEPSMIIEVRNLDVGGSEELEHLTNHNPEITWEYYNTSGDAQSDYQIQVSSFADFSLIDMWDSGIVADSDAVITYAGNALQDGHTYYLRVIVASDSTWSDWASISFRMNSVPTTPVPVSPSEGQLVSSTVSFMIMNSFDNENDTLMYVFSIYSDSTLTTIVAVGDSISETTDSTSWSAPELPENQYYWWTVYATDGYEQSARSNPRSFVLNSYNDPPVISDIPDTSILENRTISIPLIDYVIDADLPNDNITWSYFGGDSLSITITNDTAFVTNHPGWVGIDSVWFIAIDDSLASDSDLVRINIIPIPRPANLIATSGIAFSVPLIWNTPNYTPTPPPQAEELIYDDGTPSNAYVWANGARMASRLTPSWPCKILEIKFYHVTPGLFRPGIYSWTGSQPGSLLLEFDYTSTSSGWVSIDVSSYNIQVSGDFVVSNGLLNNTVSLGSDPFNNGRAWDWNGISWSPWPETYFIRAVVQELTSGQVVTISNMVGNETSDMVQIVDLNQKEKFKIINNFQESRAISNTISNGHFVLKNIRRLIPRDVLSHYNIFRSDVSGGPYIQIATNVIDTTYFDESVELATTYYYVVSATYSDPPQESGYSNEASATTAFPPILGTIPDTSFYEDDSLVLSIASWFLYVEDGDTPNEELTWSVFGSNHVSVNQLDNSLVFTATPNWYGQEQITVVVSDSQLTDTTMFSINVLSVPDDPIVLNPISDFSFNEDQIDSSINLNSVFFDGDGDQLTFSYSGNQNIDVDIISGIVYLTPDTNWFGSEAIIFTANDSANRNIVYREQRKQKSILAVDENMDLLSTASDTVTITILPVNDAPLIFSLLEPVDSVVVGITNDNLVDTLVISWEPSFDVDGDSISYTLVLTGSLNIFQFSEVNEPSISIPYMLIIDTLQSNGLLSVHGMWDISASDGEFSTESENGPFTLTFDISQVSVGKEVIIPTEFALHQNYPNPFNPTTTIAYDLPERSQVNLVIYDLLGRHVRTLVTQYEEAGYRFIIWDGTNDQGQQVGTGVYLYQIRAGDYVKTKKMVLLR